MNNVNNFSSLYRRTVNEVGVTGSTVRLFLDRVQPKRLRVVTHVSVEDKTSASTRCRVGIRAGGVDHYVDEMSSPGAAELLVSRSDILLGEGDEFFAELIGTTTGDEIVMTAIGWELDLE